MTSDIRLLLKEMVDRGGSDLYITAESAPTIRVEGVNHLVDGEPLAPTEVEALANSLMTERQRAVFEEEMEMNLGISSSKLGRFRVNVFRQRGAVGVVVRQIKNADPDHRRARLAADSEGHRSHQTRPGADHGRHRLGQVDHAGGDDRSPQ
jgi:twitching motility protein PilU